ncbi:unnamed protein product [Rhizoctonia solani]|uniref:Uncharacterized protein n=1 Tax=Rhizoctonia solani TaxID=456999 RepID=A0A8H3H1I4_9AGAM|nr:unnamed protein product [Rhizoctonia solani]
MAPALGAAVAIPNSDASLQKRNIKDSLANKLSHVGDEKAKALKAAGQGIKVAGKGVQVVGKGAKVAGGGVKVVGSKGAKVAGQRVKVVGQEIRKVEGEFQKTFTLEPESEGDWEGLGDILPACAQFDCKRNNYFMNEAMRWIKQALKDTEEVVHEHPAATVALVIGVSVLLAELISGGLLVPLMLRAVGFGVKGPIKNTIAAAVQRVINPVQLGSVFARFQSAAMGGAALGELRNIAHIVITGLIGVGVGGLIDKPHGHSAHVQKWRNWESESRIDALSNTTQYWGAPKYGGCVAYGYCAYEEWLHTR